jgi:hypothetical protein
VSTGGLIVVWTIISLLREGANCPQTDRSCGPKDTRFLRWLMAGFFSFAAVFFAWVALDLIKIYGWTAEMDDLSNELRNRCLVHIPGKGSEEMKRRNLETCIKAIFSEDDDTPEDIERKREVYIKPIIEDIVL